MGFLDKVRDLKQRVGQEINLKQSLFTTEKGQDRLIDDFLRSFATIQRLQQNQAKESAAAGGIPDDAAAAIERGIGIQGNQAAAQGITAIQNQGELSDQDAARFLLQLLQGDKAIKAGQDAQKFQALGALGGSLGRLGGSFLGGGG